jgi:hypothetical protein
LKENYNYEISGLTKGVNSKKASSNNFFLSILDNKKSQNIKTRKSLDIKVFTYNLTL